MTDSLGAPSEPEPSRKRTTATLVAGLLLLAPLLLAPKGCDALVGKDRAPCGGLTGEQCPRDQFCEFPPAAMCGAADQMGLCSPVPDECSAVLEPVCGCNGETFENTCTAHRAGVSVANDGACDGGGGGGGEPCGGLSGASCPADEFCDFPPGALCGFADAMGTCAPIPATCPTDDNPVCGCNGTTYGNPCDSHRAGISVDHEGPCP